MFSKIIFAFYSIVLVTLLVVNAAFSSSVIKQSNNIEDKSDSQGAASSAKSPRRFLAPAHNGAVLGQGKPKRRRFNRRKLQKGEEKSAYDSFKSGYEGGGKGSGKNGGLNAEFVYLSAQDLLHLSTVPSALGKVSGSAVGEVLSGDLRCTNGGFCTGVGSVSLIGQGSGDPEDQDDPTLDVIIGGPIVAAAYNPDGSLFSSEVFPGQFFFFCPNSLFEAATDDFVFTCECDAEGGDCSPEDGLLFFPGNPAIIVYAGNCINGFKARISMKCSV